MAEPELERTALVLVVRPDPPRARATIRRALACARVDPNRVNLYLIAAAAYTSLDDHENAIALYKEALQHDQRPEIYASMGNALIAAGRRDEAADMLLHANKFFPDRIYDIQDPAVRDAVARRYDEYRSKIDGRRLFDTTPPSERARRRR